jgi:glutamyl-tRNA reductase
MNGDQKQDLNKFFIAGINYKKSDSSVRGQFALTDDQYKSLLRIAPQYGLNELFVLSTCNRTEIYGFATNPLELLTLLCGFTKGDLKTFSALAYIKQGTDAIRHLFKVGAGLDSQILGDYEIVGQIKQSVKIAREEGRIGSFLDRLVNSVLQSSKTVKNNTSLSGGTVSVSFAAVQYIRDHVNDYRSKKILLIGTGKIGRNTCKNLVDYLETTNITLINRSSDKAITLADSLGLKQADISEIEPVIRRSDIILVATNASEPVVLAKHLTDGNKLVIDLSIPYNVESAASSIPGVSVLNVDDLSKMKDETLSRRKADVPKAKAIIDEHVSDFLQWLEMRRHVGVLKAVKHTLHQIKADPVYLKVAGFDSRDEQKRIQDVINVMAVKMRKQNTRGCHYIEAINDFMTLPSKTGECRHR